jgi:hypothetical protein
VIRVVVGGALVLALLVAMRGGEPRRHDVRPAPTSTPAPPAVRPEVIEDQDRVSASHRRREARAFDQRPLLNALPIERAGVRVDIAGLAADGRTTVLTLSPGSRSRAFAEQVYRRALAAQGDTAAAYRIRWQR